MNIVIVSSSPRKDSITHRVALHLKDNLIKNTPFNISLIDVRDWNLGLLQNVFSSIDKTPDEYKELAQIMFNANAFILVTPEYNGSYSAALNNLFDHFPKQSKKVFGLVTASVGAMGGMRASQQLLLLVPALFGIASPQMLIVPNVDKTFDEKGVLINATFATNIDTFLSNFLWLSKTIHINNI